jgi:RNA polymerase-binding protein DksA
MAPATRKSLASRAGAAARKVVARASDAKPSATKKAATKKAATKKVAVKKAPAKKAAAKKAATKATTAPVKKATAKKTPATTSAPTTKPPVKKTATTTPVRKTPAKKAAKKTVTANPVTEQNPAPKKTSTGGASPAKLVVLEAEDPWTKAELKEVKAQLNDDVKRLTGELAEVEDDLAGMIENSGEGAGHDQADVGSASFERDQEMVIVNNARDMLEQSQHALERIADGTYGQCENCGNPIGKNRLMAFPRATLCMTCKQREERR